MRIHRLRLQAFGPYAGAEEIDFDALGSHGPYLIHGATGAGKTSLLDAICYALYGRIPGSRSGQRETLVSDHAHAGVRPFVQLELTAAGRRLRIERSPEHTAPKKRGTGSTTRPSSVTLQEQRGGHWQAISHRLDEVGAVITDLLGMQLDQFAQVVLLPQGEFATFLRARPEERSQVLQRLFDIGRFSDAEDFLVERRKRLRANVQRGAQELREHLARAEEAVAEVDVDLGHEAWSQARATDLPELVERATSTLSTHVSDAMAQADAAAHAQEAAARALTRAQTTARLQAQAVAAEQVLARLEEAQDDRAALAARVHAAMRADVVAPFDQAHRRRRAAAGDAARAVTRAREALPGTTSADGSPQDTAAMQEGFAAGEVALRDASSLAGRADDLAQRLSAAQCASEAARQRLQSCQGRRETLQTALARAHDRIDTLTRLASEAAVQRRLLQLIELALTSLDERDAAVTEREAAERALRATLTEHQHLEGRVLELRHRRLAGIAAELALELAVGSPCAVCGSVEHPAPARASDDSVGAQDVDAAETQARASAERLTTAQRRLAAAATRAQSTSTAYARTLHEVDVAPETGAAPEDPPGVRELLERRRSAATDAVQAAERSADELARAHAACRQQERDLETLHDQVAAARDDATAAGAASRTTQEDLTSTHQALAAALRMHADRCPCPMATGGAETDVRERARTVLRDHRTHRAAADALAGAQARLETARADLREAAAELDAACEQHGFSAVEQARCSLLDRAERARLQAALDEQREAQARARGVLELPQVQEARDRPAPDLDTLRHAADQARRIALGARDRATTAERAHRSLRTLHNRVCATVERGAAERSELAVLDPLADTVSGNGDNQLRMRLTSYVLAARLESVTALANERLQAMTGGRFRLEHSDELARGGMKSGLGLRVHDAWTGRTRDTATLSGGESFMASLALALGLGDAVLQSAGGRQLQTLFVDEGFGSLDEESLEQVMDVLDGLRAGGRSVGIVSHVRELKDRIPAQVLVRKTSHGSTIEVIEGAPLVA